MTDNTPRPEPMSREQVLEILDLWNEYPTSTKRDARAAVAALYDERDALKDTLRDVGQSLLDRGVKLPREVRLRASELLGGTEASDAEGGG